MQRCVPFAVSRKTSKDKTTPINDLIDWETRKGKWVFSSTFYELTIMEFWHITPSDWNKKDEEEKAMMIAFYNTKNMMSDYEMYIEENKRKPR